MKGGIVAAVLSTQRSGGAFLYHTSGEEMSPISVYVWPLRVILITRPRDNNGYAGLLDRRGDETSPKMENSIFGLVIRRSAA